MYSKCVVCVHRCSLVGISAVCCREWRPREGHQDWPYPPRCQCWSGAWAEHSLTSVILEVWDRSVGREGEREKRERRRDGGKEGRREGREAPETDITQIKTSHIYTCTMYMHVHVYVHVYTLYVTPEYRTTKASW